MGALDRFGDALRALRIQRGFASQGELAARSGVAITTVNKIETGKRLPDFETTGSLLDAMGCSLHDLASALDQARGASLETRRGTPRPRWVAAFIQNGVDRDTIWGFVLGAIESGDDTAHADLVASCEAAAREIALGALDEARKIWSENAALVAEPKGEYDPNNTQSRRKR